MEKFLGSVSTKALVVTAAVLTLFSLRPHEVHAQDLCQTPAELTPISQCVDGSRNVVVGPSRGANCTKVFFDQDFIGTNALKKLTVEKGGEVYFREEPRTVEVAAIDISGLFQAGTKDCPIGTRNTKNIVTINFLGTRPCPSPTQCPDFTKGLQVQAGGILRLFGVKGVPDTDPSSVKDVGVTWTHLSSPAGPEHIYGPDSDTLAHVPEGGTTTITLAKDVTQGLGAWQVGDWIAIGTTGFSSVETEIVQISGLQSDGSGGSVVNLLQPLVHYHFGGPDPGEPSLKTFNECHGYNYGVDERAEVALLSRSIKLTAKIESGLNNLHWGGELRFLKGYGEISVQGVEIEKFGKDQLASYPIHFHMVGDVSSNPTLINGNSIHHSYNKCITIHMSDNITIQNNACVRIMGHIFYQEMGYESGIKFLKNLGLGAMSHYFDVFGSSVPEREKKIKKFWWAGDHLGQKDSPFYNGYDGFNIPDTAAQDGPVRGVCTTPTPNEGGLIVGNSPNTPEHPGNCKSNEIYLEPSSGFWIIHPGTDLIGNSIGGCQDVGRGYWYVPPKNRSDAGIPEDLRTLSLQPLGTFKNNRAHSCYDGLYAEPEFNMLSEQLFPREGGKVTGKSLIALFDGLTATRNRDRGVWLRPVWNVLKNGRFATNRNSVTIVSSGGLDGNAPGVWGLLEDSVVVGLSQNNADRFGPCPENAPDLYDCVHSTKPGVAAPNSAKGFPSPYYNLSGYMIYDGPIRIFRDRFVNFNKDISPRLTKSDATYLSKYTNYPHGNNPNVYEGDAALGWFQNNQSAYPTGTVSRQLSFDNVDLRHQIYTDGVNLGDFQDGDRNTALLDLDGSLTGYHVVDKNGNHVAGADPISLNNLEFNHASNSVDECLAEGQQDTIAEGRPTSLISAGHYATLEFQALFPPPLPTDPAKQTMTFKKDQKEFGAHPEMKLTSRNGLGVWEPKVASGYGYTVGASLCTRKPECKDLAGIPAKVSVGLTDAVKPGMSSTDPFFVRVGICYTNKNGTHPPAGNFSINRGYRSWGGNGTDTGNVLLRQYFNILINRYQNEICHILDFQNPSNICPAHGVSAIPNGGCKSPSVAGVDQQNNPACIYPTSTLQSTGAITDLTNPDGTPNLDKYFYDASKGLLFFNVVQDIPNAFGPSPLGSCKGDTSDPLECPDTLKGESYYACPPGGCIDYVVNLGGAYDPGPSNCEPYPDYELPIPAEELKLAYIGGSRIVEQVEAGGKNNNFPHYEPKVEPECPKTVVAGDELNDLLGIKFVDLDPGEDPDPPKCPPDEPLFRGGGCALNSNMGRNAGLILFLALPILVFWRGRARSR